MLTEAQIQAGLFALQTWSAQAWTDEDATVWRQTLKHYRSGELSTCLDAWSLTERGQFRPRPGDLARFRAPAKPHYHQSFTPPPEPPKRTAAADRAAAQVFQKFEHLMPSRRQVAS